MITEVIQNMLSFIDKDKKELFASLCELPVLQEARAHVLAGSPEGFMYSLPYHFERIVDGLLETVIPKQREAQFIFRHYQFLELNFKDIIQRYEGSCCCADKSRTILKRLTHFYLTGNEIVFDPMDMTAFSYPTTVFTTHSEIVNFFNGLYNLYYGRPALYLEALNNTQELVK